MRLPNIGEIANRLRSLFGFSASAQGRDKAILSLVVAILLVVLSFQNCSQRPFVLAALQSNNVFSTQFFVSITNLSDGYSTSSFVRPSAAGLSYAQVKIGGFDATKEKVYVCLNFSGSADCSRASGYAQAYPIESGSAWRLEGGLLKLSLDIYIMPESYFEIVVRKDLSFAQNSATTSSRVAVVSPSIPVVMNPSPQSASTPAPSSPTGPSSSSFQSDYDPVVSSSNASFSALFSPVSGATGSVLFEDPDNPAAKEFILVGRRSNASLLRWRVFIPPGAKSFDASLTSYSNPVETRAAARFGLPPVSTYDQVTEANIDVFNRAEVLNLLMGGRELRYFSPVVTFYDGTRQGSGTTRFSEGNSGSTSALSRGGWVYFNILEVPGKLMKGLDIRIVVDQACYRSWFANAKFDSSGNPIEGAEHTCSGTK